MNSTKSSASTVAWLVWITASVFYAYQYILRVMPSIMLDDIMQQFHINAATFGQFSGIYYIGYSLMHLPIGIMLDRYGPRNVMTACILLTVAGMLPLIFADHWIYPIAGRLLVGMGSSAAILGVFKIIRMTFSEERFPRMLSISVTIGLIGAIYGGGPLRQMQDAFGYQTVIQVMALAGVALALLTYWIVPKSESKSEGTVMADVKEVLTNFRVIGICLFAGFMVGPLEGFADVWGTSFLKQVYGFDGVLSASLPSLIFIGMCFGGPLLNFIAEKVGSYIGTIVAAGVVMAASFVALLSFNLASGFVSVSFVVLGICCAYQILAIYLASTFVREQVAGLTTALANMIIMIFGYAFHSIMGGIINSMGGAGSSIALDYGVAVIPVGLFIGTIGFLFIASFEKQKMKTIINEELQKV